MEAPGNLGGGVKVRGIFPSQHIQGRYHCLLILQLTDGAEGDDAAVTGGIKRRHHIVLGNDTEGSLGAAGDGVQLVPGRGAVEIEPAPMIDIADGQGVRIALLPGQGQHAGRTGTENLLRLGLRQLLDFSAHFR